MSKFKERLAEALEMNNLSPSEFATIYGFQKSSISMYLSGEHFPRPEVLEKMATELGVSPEWLRGEAEPRKYIKVETAARLMSKGQQFIRIGLQRNILPIGAAVKNGSKWNYYISPKKFEDFTGIQLEEVDWSFH